MAKYINKPAKNVNKPAKYVKKPLDQFDAVPVDTCCCPSVVVYLVESECLVLNNTGCPDWQLCQSGVFPMNRKEDY